MDILKEIAWHSFLWLLWGGSVVAVLLGIGLLIVPQRVERLNRFLARWIDTGQIEASFDRPRSADRYVYRRHRIFGPLLALGSLFVLYRFLLSPLKVKLSPVLSKDVFGLFDAASAFFVIASVLGVVIGLVMTFRPSMLREFEAVSNRWISGGRMVVLFNEPRLVVDQKALAHKTTTAVFLILGGSYVAFLLGKVLFAGQWQL